MSATNSEAPSPPHAERAPTEAGTHAAVPTTLPTKMKKSRKQNPTAAPTTNTITVLTSAARRKRGGVTAMAVTTSAAKTGSVGGSKSGARRGKAGHTERGTDDIHRAHPYGTSRTPPPPPSATTAETGVQPLVDAERQLVTDDTRPSTSSLPPPGASGHTVPSSARSSDSVKTTASTVSSSTQTNASTRAGSPEHRYKNTLANLHAKRTKRSTRTDADTPSTEPHTSGEKRKLKAPKAVGKTLAAAPPPPPPSQPARDQPTVSPSPGVLAQINDVLARQAALFERVDASLAALDNQRTRAPVALAITRPTVPDVGARRAAGAQVASPDAAEDDILSPFSQVSLSPRSHSGFSPTLPRRPGSLTEVSSFAATGADAAPAPTVSPAATAPTLGGFPAIHTLLSPGSSVDGSRRSPIAAGTSLPAVLPPPSSSLPDQVGEWHSPPDLADGACPQSMVVVSPVSVSSSPSASTTSTASCLSSVPTSFSDHRFLDEGDSSAGVSPVPHRSDDRGRDRTADDDATDNAAHRFVESRSVSLVEDVSTSTTSASPLSFNSSAASTTPPLASGGGGVPRRTTRPGAPSAAMSLTAVADPATHADDNEAGPAAEHAEGEPRRWAIPPVRVVRRPPIAPVNRPSPLRKSGSHRSDSLYTTTSSSNNDSPTREDIELYLRANARLEEEEALEEQQRLQLIFEQQLRQCEEEEREWEGTDNDPSLGSTTEASSTSHSAHSPLHEDTTHRPRSGGQKTDSTTRAVLTDDEKVEARGHSPRSPQAMRVHVLTLASSAHSRRYVRRRRHTASANAGRAGGRGTSASSPSGGPAHGHGTPTGSGHGEPRATSPQTDEDERRFDARMAELEQFRKANLHALRGHRADGADDADDAALSHSLSTSDIMSSSTTGGDARKGKKQVGATSQRRGARALRGRRVNGGSGGGGGAAQSSPPKASDVPPPGLHSPDSTTPDQLQLAEENEWDWSPMSSSASTPTLSSPGGGTEVVVHEYITDAALSAAKAVALAAGGIRGGGGSGAGGGATMTTSTSRTRTVPPLSLALMTEAAGGPVKPRHGDDVSQKKASATSHSRTASSGTTTPSSAALISPGDPADALSRSSQSILSHHTADSSGHATRTNAHGTTRTPRFRLARTPRGTSHPNMLGRRRTSAKTAMISLMTGPGVLTPNASAGTPMTSTSVRGGAARTPLSSSSSSPAAGGRRRGTHSQLPSPSSALGAKPSTGANGASSLSPVKSTAAAAPETAERRAAAPPPPHTAPEEPAERPKKTAVAPRRRAQTVLEKGNPPPPALSTGSSASGRAAVPAGGAAVRPRRASMPTLPTSTGASWFPSSGAPSATRTAIAKGEHVETAAPAPVPRRRASVGDVPTSRRLNATPTVRRATPKPPRRPSDAEDDANADRRHSHNSTGDGDTSSASACSPQQRRATMEGTSSPLPPHASSERSPPDVPLAEVESGSDLLSATTTRTPSDVGEALADGASPRTPYCFPASPTATAPPDQMASSQLIERVDVDASGVLTTPPAARPLSPLRRSRSDSEALASPPRLHRRGESEDAAPRVDGHEASTGKPRGAAGGPVRVRRATYQAGTADHLTRAAVPHLEHRRTASQDAAAPPASSPSTLASAAVSGSVSPSFLRYHERLSRRDGSRTKAMEGLLLSDTLQSQLSHGAASPLARATAPHSTDAPSTDTTAPPSACPTPTHDLSSLSHSPVRGADSSGLAASGTPPSGPVVHVATALVSGPGAGEEESEGSGGRGTGAGGANRPAPVDRRRRLQTRMTPKPGVTSPSAASAAKNK